MQNSQMRAKSISVNNLLQDQEIIGQFVSKNYHAKILKYSGRPMKNQIIIAFLFIISFGCVADNRKIDNSGQSGESSKPALNALELGDTDTTSITLEQPTLADTGGTASTVNAFIGLDGTISITNSTVSNASEEDIDVSSNGHTFTNLETDTDYRIIVVAKNSAGYSVQEIEGTTDSLASVAPVLEDLVISSSDHEQITLSQPSFSTDGNPAPTVKAHIGVNSSISISGVTVTGSSEGDIDVSGSGHTFSSLDATTSYRIIVVAENSEGKSKKEIK